LSEVGASELRVILIALGIVFIFSGLAAIATSARAQDALQSENGAAAANVARPGAFDKRAVPPADLGTDPQTGLARAGTIGTIVTLRALDKVTAETRDLKVRVGEDIRFGSLTIRAHYCRKRPPEEPPEVLALVEVFDRATDGRGQETEPARIFSGWMFASNPALNALEHGVFDVWPLDCA
jgi:hypothetical protein